MTLPAYQQSETLAGLRWLSEPIMNKSFYGDVWSCAWADDGNLYSAADDTWGGAHLFPDTIGAAPDATWGADFTGANLSIYRIDGPPENTSIELLNKMAPYGHATWREERATWKANGLTCVDGVLYMSVSQHAYAFPGDHIQRTYDATIVKSTDYGQTWSQKPEIARPMFPGHWFSTPIFVQFGQDYSGAMDEFVYAVSNSGSWNNGNYLILGRTHRGKLSGLDAGDWEYFAGHNDEQEPIWVNSYLDAVATFRQRNHTSMANIQYVPALDRFILLEWAYTDLDDPERPFSHTTLNLYESTKPWGPWRHVFTDPDWNHASYNPGMPAKWFEEDGKRFWLTSSADFCRRHNDGSSFAYYFLTAQQFELPRTTE